MPELLYLVWECPEFDGRQLSVQRFVDAEAAGDPIWTLTDVQRAEFFADFGRAVGWLHSFDLPEFSGWVDDRGETHATWADAARPDAAIRAIRDQGSLVSAGVLTEAERRIECGLAALPTVQPRLVHRDLHLDNTLIASGRFVGLIDFELVREWDFVWDFANRLQGVFDCYEGCEDPFLAGYREIAGELPPSFALQHWLYTGIYEVLCIEECLEGNQAYTKSHEDLRTWLDTPVPL